MTKNYLHLLFCHHKEEFLFFYLFLHINYPYDLVGVGCFFDLKTRNLFIKRRLSVHRFPLLLLLVPEPDIAALVTHLFVIGAFPCVIKVLPVFYYESIVNCCRTLDQLIELHRYYKLIKKSCVSCCISLSYDNTCILFIYYTGKDRALAVKVIQNSFSPFLILFSCKGRTSFTF